MNIYNTNKRTSKLVSEGFTLVSYPSITHFWLIILHLFFESKMNIYNCRILRAVFFKDFKDNNDFNE